VEWSGNEEHGVFRALRVEQLWFPSAAAAAAPPRGPLHGKKKKAVASPVARMLCANLAGPA